tara:strand:- start:13 stop:1218 length:1206 start_codon:yes stop_codon:yes gene_type:complete
VDVLLRNLALKDIECIRNNKDVGKAQNIFIRNLISEARNNTNKLNHNQFSNLSIQYNNTPFTFIDLFAGIGGFRSALTFLGGKCMFTNEWNKYALTTYKHWYGNDLINSDDIRTIDHSSIPPHDILCAGFPCQPFSLAGVSKKNALGRKHGFQDAEQGNLFDCIMNIVDVKKPPILFLENVKNLNSHDQGKTWKYIQRSIHKRGYQIFSKVIDSSYWVPQHRERIFIVCFDKSIFSNKRNINFSFPDYPINREYNLHSILEKSPNKKYMLSDKLWSYLKDYAAKHRAKGNGFGYGLADKNGITRTMSARYYKDGAEILIVHDSWPNPRRLTPNEAKYLMGFDNKYALCFGHKNGFPQIVSDTQAYKQFGNSVVPLVIEQIMQSIITEIVRYRLESNLNCIR